MLNRRFEGFFCIGRVEEDQAEFPPAPRKILCEIRAHDLSPVFKMRAAQILAHEGSGILPVVDKNGA